MNTRLVDDNSKLDTNEVQFISEPNVEFVGEPNNAGNNTNIEFSVSHKEVGYDVIAQSEDGGYGFEVAYINECNFTDNSVDEDEHIFSVKEAIEGHSNFNSFCKDALEEAFNETLDDDIE